MQSGNLLCLRPKDGTRWQPAVPAMSESFASLHYLPSTAEVHGIFWSLDLHGIKAHCGIVRYELACADGSDHGKKAVMEEQFE